MPGYTRHQLKEDRIAKAISDQVHWTVDHRKIIIIVVIVVAIAAIAAVGGWTMMKNRDDQASKALGEAVRVYSTPLNTPGQQTPPEVKTFDTAKARSEAAHKEFAKVAADFPSTKNGKYAQYMAGVTAAETGDTKKAEELFNLVITARDSDLSSLARLSLASLYAAQKKDADAIKLYKEVIQADSNAMPKVAAQIELASYYEANNNTAEAIKIYEEIQKSEESDRKKAAPAAKTTSNDPKAVKAPEVKTPIEAAAEAKIQQLKQIAK